MVIRNIDRTPMHPVRMEGAHGTTMGMMVGREDGAPNFSLRHVRVEAEGHTPRHSHDYEHEVVVLEGRGTVLLEGKEHPIGPGDVFLVPPDEEHQFKAVGEGLRFLCLVPVSRNCGAPTPGS